MKNEEHGSREESPERQPADGEPAQDELAGPPTEESDLETDASSAAGQDLVSYPVTQGAMAAAKSIERSVPRWRADLLRGPQFDIAVGSSIARAVANFQMSSLAFVEPVLRQQQQLEKTLALIRGPYASIAESIEATTAPARRQQQQLEATIRAIQGPYDLWFRSVEALRSQIINAIQPAAFFAASGLGDQLRRASEINQAYDKALSDIGWWFPPSLPQDVFWTAGKAAVARDRTAVRRTMVDAAQRRSMYRVVDTWMDQEAFARRRRFILDGLRDHRRERYRVSIPTLLPLIEGIAIEEFAPGDSRGPKQHIIDAVSQYRSLEAEAIVEAVTVLWAHTAFSIVPRATKQLNRHVILHGRSIGYGTEANSAKVLYALDLLHALVVDKRKRVTSSP